VALAFVAVAGVVVVGALLWWSTSEPMPSEPTPLQAHAGSKKGTTEASSKSPGKTNPTTKKTDKGPNDPGDGRPINKIDDTSRGETYPRRALLISATDVEGEPLLEYGRQPTPTDPGSSPHALAMQLEAGLKFPKKQIAELSNKTKDTPPSKAAIEAAVAEFLATSRAQDCLLLLFAGHVVEIAGEAYLVPRDGQRKNPATLIALDWLLTELGKSKAHQIVLVLDVGRGAPLGEVLHNKVAKVPAGVRVLLPCQAKETALELSGGSLLLEALCQACKTAPATKPHEPIPVDMLADRVGQYVQDKAKAKGQQQTTALSGNDRPGQLPFNSKEAPPPELNVSKFVSGGPLTGPKFMPGAKAIKLDLGDGVHLEVVYLESGKFLMGSPKEEPFREGDELQHEVQLAKPFYIGAHPVTQRQYRQVMGNNHSAYSPQGASKNVVKEPTDDFPVETVKWQDAVDFCTKASALSGATGKGWVVDLPTEAEWEYACRAGSTTAFHFGSKLVYKEANFFGNAVFDPNVKDKPVGHPTKIGSYPPNAWGLYDMHGNVCQWCKDWYVFDYYKDSVLDDPLGPAKGEFHVNRGGSYLHLDIWCRSAYRNRTQSRNLAIFMTDTTATIGFRVVVRRAPKTP
jgi:formylglycine-generating enzyme required for sulfatase activity